MAKTGPLIIIEDDQEDRELLQQALTEIGIKHTLKFFSSAEQALEYLMVTQEQPFLILTDLNLPGMDGLAFQQVFQQSAYLRSKCIPLIFFSTTDSPMIIKEAYTNILQGFFQKPSTFIGLKLTLLSITDYWERCLHPNSQVLHKYTS